MAQVEYVLGGVADMHELYPPARYANQIVGLKDYRDVIRHYESVERKVFAESTGVPPPSDPFEVAQDRRAQDVLRSGNIGVGCSVIDQR